MSLYWWGAALVFLVAAFMFLIWDCATQFKKNNRLIRLCADQVARYGEDLAWLNRHVEYQHAVSLTLQRAEVEKVDALVAFLDRVQTLEVVA